MEVDGPDAELIALLTEHIQALLEEQGREFGRGGGGAGELSPRKVLRLRQQHVKLHEAMVFLRMLTRVVNPGGRGTSPEEGGSGLGGTRDRPGETENRSGQSKESLGGGRSCSGKEGKQSAQGGASAPPVSVSTSEGFSAVVSEVGFEGRDPAAGARGPGHPTAEVRLRGGGAESALRAQTDAIAAKERLFAERLRSLRQQKPVDQMTADDFVELMDVFRPDGAATWQPEGGAATWQLPVVSGPPVSAVTGLHSLPARSEAQNSVAPSSLASQVGGGVKRPHFLDLNLPAPGEINPAAKRESKNLVLAGDARNGGWGANGAPCASFSKVFVASGTAKHRS